MQQNAPFCVLLKNGGGGGFVANPRPSTAFSLSRVGMYDSVDCNFHVFCKRNAI